MKELIIIRHGRVASKEFPSDAQRELSAEGFEQLKQQAARLNTVHCAKPIICVASSAVRTMQSAETFIANYNHDCTLVKTSAIYNAPLAHLVSTIKDLEDTYPTAILVGHMPAVYQLTSYLLSNAQTESEVSFGTATMAIFKLNINKWSDLTHHSGVMEHFFTAPI